MEKGQELFVKIQYKREGICGKSKSCDTKMNFKANENVTKYLMAGGVYNKNGGTIIFRARDLDEANEIAQDNPLIRNLNENNIVDYNVLIFSNS